MFSVNFRATLAAPSDKLELEIIKILSNAGLCTLNTSIFVGKKVLPTGDGPYTYLRVYGGSEIEEMHSGEQYENPSFQIVVYAADYEVAKNKIYAIWRELDGQRNVTIAA